MQFYFDTKKPDKGHSGHIRMEWYDDKVTLADTHRFADGWVEELVRRANAYDGLAEAKDDVDRLVRELDVLLNGEEGAAKQASLCDIVGQVRAEGIKSPQSSSHKECLGWTSKYNLGGIECSRCPEHTLCAGRIAEAEELI